MNTSVSSLGAISAFLLLGMLLGVVGLLRDARSISSAQKGVEKHNHSNSNDIIVPITMGTDVCAAAYLACQLGRPYSATIILAYIMDLPPTLALDVALPDWEQDAERALTEGEIIVRQQGLPVELRIIRHRTVAGAILDLVRATDAREIVLSTRKTTQRFFPRVDPTVTQLLRRAPCQVIVAESFACAM